MMTKHFRTLVLLPALLLMASAAQAQQYLNVFTPSYSPHKGSVPLEKFDSVAFTRDNGICIVVNTTEGAVTIPTSDVDSLSITDQPAYLLPGDKAFLSVQAEGESQPTVLPMLPVWGQPGVFHLLHFVKGSVTVSYSFDGETWQSIPVVYNSRYAYDGWNQFVLDARTEGCLFIQQFPLYSNNNRSSRARQGFAFITGSTTGDWTDGNGAWKMSMPVNDGWWASPRFVADGEVRAYAKLIGFDWWRTEFTIHDGRVFWRDSDIPSNWAGDKGTDYSVQGKKGQKLYVNFTTGEALVSTPDEVPFPLENPVFRTSSTVNTGVDDPTLCTIAGDNGNTVQLYWDAVDGASGYRIKMGLQQNMAPGGSTVWDNPDNVLLDTTVDAATTEFTIADLNYATNYRFAIQALSPRGEQYNSAWFGYGNGRYWYAYLGLTTNERYAVPSVVSVSNVTTNSARVNLNFSIADESGLEDMRSHFNFTDEAKTLLRVDYITVEPAQLNPAATVPAAYAKYELTDADRERGYVDVTGLDENSAYLFKAWDATIASPVDACYNTVTKLTKGTPGAPVLLKHADIMAGADQMMIDNYYIPRAEVYSLANDYDAAPLSPVISNFMSTMQYAEGQTFYLEGGKTYYVDGNDNLCKGFTLATLPEDVAKGKRARIICGIGKNANIFSQGTNGEQWNGPYAMFILGRQQEAGESELEMEKIAFCDIDFDNPKALNYGDNAAGVGTVAGNYFFNMYSNGLGMTLDSLVMENCTFKRLVRGFIRDQGPNSKVWNHVLIKNNQFFDCGYYNQGAGGYGMIHGSGQNVASNLYKDMQVVENTFYDSPFPALFAEQNAIDWTAGPWNITFSNNTLVNFNTRANGAIFKMRNLPDGSVYNVKNNLLVLCKQEGDQRVLQMWGADIRNTQTKPDGTAGHVTLNFENNWSTNNDLTNGSVFSASPWTVTSNNFGKLVKDGTATLNGTLEVQVAGISATELMVQPCPPHVAATANDQNMHRANALDGTATEYNVNLRFKNTDNDIVKNKAGASRWY